MHDPAKFRPTPKMGLVTEESNASRRDTPLRPPPQGATIESVPDNDADERKERYSEGLQRAMLAVPPGKTPAEYARLSAVHSYRAADASAEAFEMSGKAFSAATEARNESKATKAFLIQVMDDNPNIASRVKRTMSGTMKAVTVVSVPPPAPPLPPLELPRNASQTGTNYTIPLETLKKLEEQIRERDIQQKERDAEERGKQAVLVAQANALAAEQAATKAARDKWLFVFAVLSIVGTAVAFAIGHLSIHP